MYCDIKQVWISAVCFSKKFQIFSSQMKIVPFIAVPSTGMISDLGGKTKATRHREVGRCLWHGVNFRHIWCRSTMKMVSIGLRYAPSKELVPLDSITVSLFIYVFFSLTNSESALARAHKWV